MLLPLVFVASCRGKDNPDSGEDMPEFNKEANTKKYVNIFTYNMVNTYYLWVDESQVQSLLDSWDLTCDPVERLKAVRYKDSAGNEIDRWTQLTDDYKTFTSSVAGTSTTYGFDFNLYYYDSSRTSVCAVVTVVYADSPAAKAGLKRGDCIVKVAGKTMTPDNYKEVINGSLYGASKCTLTMYGGGTVTMSPVSMYEDPVILYKTFDCSGKKVGYLFYNSFTQSSYLRLIEACKFFKQEGVSELILDLRYNGGGFTVTEQALASMLAPEDVVTSKKVLETEVYNKRLTEAWGNNPVTFTTDFSYSENKEYITYSTADANIGLKKIYALVTGASASASESLIGCLMPYIDIEVIGQNTLGKFCSGIIHSSNEWYESVKDQLPSGDYDNGLRYADNWGIYIMIGRYADKDGKTACMPNGIAPDTLASDNPMDGRQLGDPEESMLGIALAHAGYVPAATSSVRVAGTETTLGDPLPFSEQPRRPEFGMKIDDFSIR